MSGVGPTQPSPVQARGASRFVWPGPLVRLVVPLGVLVVAFGMQVGALLLTAGQHAVSTDFAWVGLVTFGSGVPATFLGYGSSGVLAVRWPLLEWLIAGGFGVVALGALAHQVVGGAVIVQGMTTPSGEASLLFALWTLKWAIPMTAVAFLGGRAAAGRREPSTDASSSPR